MSCQFCGCVHGVLCPRVKAMEYHANGTLRRVEFRDEQPVAVEKPRECCRDWAVEEEERRGGCKPIPPKTPAQQPMKDGSEPTCPRASSCRYGCVESIDRGYCHCNSRRKQIIFDAESYARSEFNNHERQKQAANRPRDKQTPHDVACLRASVYSCCNAHADMSGCSCMDEAVDRVMTGKV